MVAAKHPNHAAMRDASVALARVVSPTTADVARREKLRTDLAKTIEAIDLLTIARDIIMGAQGSGYENVPTYLSIVGALRFAIEARGVFEAELADIPLTAAARVCRAYGVSVDWLADGRGRAPKAAV